MMQKNAINMYHTSLVEHVIGDNEHHTLQDPLGAWQRWPSSLIHVTYNQKQRSHIEKEVTMLAGQQGPVDRLSAL